MVRGMGLVGPVHATLGALAWGMLHVLCVLSRLRGRFVALEGQPCP